MPATTNNGFVSQWDFSNKHVDTNLDPSKDLISSARCLIYAKPSSFGTQDNSAAVKFYRIGLVQDYGFTENRYLSRIFEIGSDVPYVVPGRTEGSLNLSRIMLFGSDLVNALYYSSQNNGITNDELYNTNTEAINGAEGSERIIRSINDIDKPIDLLITFFKPTGTANAESVTRYSRVFQQCMISARSENVTANQIIVGENVSIMYAKMGPVKM